MTSQITELTRRDIFDYLRVTATDWAGRLNEPDFLSRIYDVENMPSTDSRFKNAYGDIWQHRINNDDWDADWVFTDSRFQLNKPLDANGKAALLVADDSLEGTMASLVILDASGRVVCKEATTVGGDK